MGDIAHTILESFVSLALLFFLARLIGKKLISQLTFFDYVVGTSIGSIAAAFAVEDTIDYARGITGLVVFASFPLLMSLLSLKSYRARKLLDGKPIILIDNGKIVRENLKKTKLTVNDLLENCHLNNAFNITEVEFAVFETSGKLSILKKSQNQALTPKDMDLPTSYIGLCLNVIVDGKIIYDNLKLSGKNVDWIINELKKKEISDIKKVILAFFDSNGQFIALKDFDQPVRNPLL